MSLVREYASPSKPHEIVHFVGIDFRHLVPSKAEIEQTRMLTDALVADQDLLYCAGGLTSPQPNAVPIYRADDGSLFAPHPDNPALGLVAYAPGPEISYDEASVGSIGFLPAAGMAGLAASMPVHKGTGLPIHRLLAAHAPRSADAEAHNQASTGQPGPDRNPEQQAEGGSQQTLPEGASAPHAPRPLLSSFQMGSAQRALPAALGGVVRGNTASGLANAFTSAINPTAIGFGFAAQYIGAQVQAAFQKAWPIDDTASTGEWVSHSAAQKALEKLQGMAMDWVASRIRLGDPNAPEMLQQIKGFFTLATSHASLGAATRGTLDDKGNVVNTGNTHQVLVNAMVAAVGLEGTDILTPAGMPIIDGSTTVLIGGVPFSRATAATAVPSALTPPNTSTDVLVGGLGLPPSLIQALQNNPMSFPPNQVLQAASAIKAQENYGHSDSPEEAQAKLEAQKPTPRRAIDIANVTAKNERQAFEDMMANGGKVPQSERQYVQGPDGLEYANIDSLGIDTGLVLRETFPPLSELPVNLQSGGFFAVVLEDIETGQIYISYRGSDTGIIEHFQEDWLFTNLAEGFGLVPSQYNQALATAEAVMGNPLYAGKPIMTVGHSLGGGLSSYVAGMLGLPSFNLNSAGLGSGLMNNLVNHGVPVVPGQIQHYNTSNDILSNVVNHGTFGQYGESYWVQGTGPAIISFSPANGHGTNAFYQTDQQGRAIMPAQWPSSLSVKPFTPPLPNCVIPPYF